MSPPRQPPGTPRSSPAPPPCLDLTLLDDRLAVCRLAPASDLPAWALSAGAFSSITRTAGEWSIVCSEDLIPPGIQCERGWRILEVAGPLDFRLTGILASIAGPLAEARVSLFALSTYDTDYVMVKAQTLDDAVRALEAAGHWVRR